MGVSKISEEGTTMLHTINHTCGHTTEQQIYGTNVHGERDRRVAHLETTLCPECFAKAQAGVDVTEVEMPYAAYKSSYADHKTKPGSYNAKAKTIIVYIPAETKTEEEEPEMTTDKRTPDDILSAVYALTDGYIGDTDRIAECQRNLAAALIWEECPPVGGWLATRDRQVAALMAMPEPPQSNDPLARFADDAPIMPRETIEAIRDAFDAGRPWDVAAVDAAIIAQGGVSHG